MNGVVKLLLRACEAWELRACSHNVYCLHVNVALPAVSVSVVRWGEELVALLSVSPVSPGGCYYLNYWEQSAETHLTTDLSISTRSAFLSLFKTRKYWLVLWVSRQFSNNQEYRIFIQDPQLLIRDRKIKFNLQETCGTWESHVKEKRKWNMISMSFVIFPIVCTMLF